MQTVRDFFDLRDRLDRRSEEVDYSKIYMNPLSKLEHQVDTDLQQRNARGDDVVQDIEDLIVVASLARTALKKELEKMKQELKIDCQVGVGKVLDAQRISEQAQLIPERRESGSPHCWMYNVCSGSIVCTSAEDISLVINWISRQPAMPVIQLLRTFSKPDPVTRYRQLILSLKIPLGRESWHICEILVHHKDLFPYFEQVKSYDNHLQDYFRGTTNPQDLLERLDDLQTIGGYSSEQLLEEGFCQVISMCRNPFRLERIADLFDYALPAKSDISFALYQKLLALATESEDSLATAVVHMKLGNVLMKKGQYDGAMKHFDGFVSLLSSQLGEGDERNLRIANELGTLHECQGRYAEAVEVLSKAIDTAESFLGSNHPLTATLHSNLGSALRKCGDYSGALDHQEIALKVRQAILGKHHAETALSYDRLGVVMQENGDFDFALLYHRRALRLRLQVGTPMDLAESYENLGLLLFRQKVLERSLPLLKQSLEIREMYCGQMHPLTARSLICVGIVLQGAGHYSHSQEFFEQALDVRRKILGESHPDTAVAYSSIGTVLRKTGDLSGAIRMHEKALEISTISVGKHPQTAIFCCNLGTVLAKTGQFDQAILQYRRAASIRSELLGPQHKETLQTYQSIEAIISAKTRADGNRQPQ